jgi:mannitol-1-phosphate 5-dehydrogenase
MAATPSQPKIVVFGAGSAGKGLIGLLFHQAGYRVVFVDIDRAVVEQLAGAGAYRVLVHGLDGGKSTEEVTPFTILAATDRAQVAREIVDADLVLTAVFVQNLPDVAQTLALAVTQCRRAGRHTPLNCIACENMKRSSSTLARQVLALLDEEDRSYAQTTVGFPDCMINRVVPKSPSALRLETEDYCEWTADVNALQGPPPPGVQFIEWVDNQDARLDRKLMVYNGTHAASAYYGHRAGHTWLHDAVADEKVIPYIQGTLDQLAATVACHHGFSDAEMEKYKYDFWRRGRNPGLRDAIVRVARQPQRKLGRYERLVGPALLAQDHGLPRHHIVEAIWAALHYRHPEDSESQALAQSLETQGMRRTLATVGDLAPDDPLLDELESTPPIQF